MILFGFKLILSIYLNFYLCYILFHFTLLYFILFGFSFHLVIVVVVTSKACCGSDSPLLDKNPSRSGIETRLSRELLESSCLLRQTCLTIDKFLTSLSAGAKQIKKGIYGTIVRHFRWSVSAN